MMGDYFSQSQQQFTSAATTDTSKKIKNKATNKSCRPVTIKQMKDVIVHGESTFFLDNEELTDVTFIGIVHSITRQDNTISYNIEDGSGSIEVKSWKMDQDMDQIDLTNKNVRVDEYARVFGRLHQFNNHITAIGNYIMTIQDPNELTYHFIDTIYTHITIGKLDVVSIVNNFCLGANSTIRDYQTIVKRAIHENSSNQLGAYVPTVVIDLKEKLNEQQVLDIIYELSNNGELYNTNDDHHVKLVEDF